MPHSWKAYEVAKEIVDNFLQGNLINPKDALMIRGIIQIKIEDFGV